MTHRLIRLLFWLSVLISDALFLGYPILLDAVEIESLLSAHNWLFTARIYQYPGFFMSLSIVQLPSVVVLLIFGYVFYFCVKKVRKVLFGIH